MAWRKLAAKAGKLASALKRVFPAALSPAKKNDAGVPVAGSSKFTATHLGSDTAITGAAKAKAKAVAKAKADAKGNAKANSDQAHEEKEAARQKALLVRAENLEVTADGYKEALEFREVEAVRAFLRRVPAREKFTIIDQERFESMLRFYDGQCGTGTYAAVVAELYSAEEPSACSEPWVTKASGKEEGHSAKLIERWAGMEDRLPTWRWQAHAAKKGLLSWALEHQAEKSSAQESQSLVGRVTSLLRPSLGKRAPLDEQGYEAVADTGDEEEMQTFIHRAAEDEGLDIVDETALSAMLPFYAGSCERQSYAKLVAELRRGALRPAACGGPWTK